MLTSVLNGSVMVIYSGNIAVSLLDLRKFKQLLLFFHSLITTVNLDAQATAVDISISGTLMIANSGSFTVLHFDIDQLKQLLLYVVLL